MIQARRGKWGGTVELFISACRSLCCCRCCSVAAVCTAAHICYHSEQQGFLLEEPCWLESQREASFRPSPTLWPYMQGCAAVWVGRVGRSSIDACSLSGELCLVSGSQLWSNNLVSICNNSVSPPLLVQGAERTVLFGAVRQCGCGVLQKFILLSVLQGQSIFFPCSHNNGSEITWCMLRKNGVLRGVAERWCEGVNNQHVSGPSPALLLFTLFGNFLNLSPLPDLHKSPLTSVNIVTSSICTQNNVAWQQIIKENKAHPPPPFRLDLYLAFCFLADARIWLSIFPLPSQFLLPFCSSLSWPCCWGPASATPGCCLAPCQRRPHLSRWKLVSHGNCWWLQMFFIKHLLSQPPV